MRIPRLLYIVLLLLGVSSLWAGRYAGDFMAIGAGVRSQAMGGAFSAVADDGSAIYWNPSALANLKRPQAMVMRAFLYDGLAAYDHFSYCQPLPNDVTIGVAWTRLSVDKIPVFDEKYLVGTNIDQRTAYFDLHLPGTPDGSFTSTDDLFQFAFAKQLHYDMNMGWLFFAVPVDVNVGGSIKYIKRKLYQNLGTGNGVDLAATINTPLSKIVENDNLGDFTFAFVMQDIGGTEIVWDTSSNHKDKVLFNTKTGYSYHQPIKKWNSTLRFSYDKDFVYNQPEHWGMECMYKDLAGVMLGYSDNNFSAGVEFKLYNLNIDYAFIRMGEIERNTNRIGLRINF